MSLLQNSILLMAAINIIFALIVYLHSKKTIQEVFFIFSAFCVGLWSLAVLILVSQDIGLSFFKFGLISHFWAGNFIFLSFLWFAWFYKNQVSKQYIVFPIFISAVDIALLLIMAFSDFVVQTIKLADNLNDAIGINNTGYTIYSIYLFCIFLIIESILAKKYSASIGEERKRLGYIILGTLIAGLLGLTTNLFLPGFGIFSFFALGPALSTIFVALISYAILRHALFDLRIIAAELFTIILVIIVVGNIFTTQNKDNILIGGIIFVFILIVGTLLIRSVYREVRQREEIEHLATNLSIANAELKTLDAAKSDFISLAGHQLRAPLTAIKGYVSMVLEGSYGAINKDVREALGRVFISADQLVKMASDLLDLSRMESGKFKYEFMRLDFSAIIKKAINELEQISKERGVVIKFIDENKDGINIMADANKMHEIVINLLDNALKYTTEGHVIVKIKVIYEKSARYLRLSVQDTGIGVERNELSKLFTKFVRTEGARKTRPEGMGLGLYFVKKIAESHGGRVTAESDGTGKGSAFIVDIPAVS